MYKFRNIAIPSCTAIPNGKPWQDASHVIGAQKGRLLNSTVPYKGPLSSSSRAVAKRERKDLPDKEEKILDNTRAADRAAKYQLKKLYLPSPAYTSASQGRQEDILRAAYKNLASGRFKQKKSGRLKTNLTLVHKK
ncbi:hypothetical protein PTTW11_05452 [Pyrenophora teres f. teres]|uniref:Uncharacterized protein n=1 Tax=Pyrenophora teres f. teres TaxID=97479 RepID=A0A6S6W227_9PLEO|nr:hypothetical protein PTTW11_05452 [Pyrenophora teres f. teres]